MDTKRPAQEHAEHASAEHEIRVNKIEQLRAQGIEPWPEAQAVDATCQQVLGEFTDDAPSKEYRLAGRLKTKREHGKTIFADLHDRSGRLQLYFRKDALGDAAFELLQHGVDVGDIVWVKGTAFRTKMGEVTLKVDAFVLVSKCLHPLPEKFHGLTDIEVKYRQRYLDLISNPESKERFIKRSLIVREMRRFLDDHDFLEVETPMLHPIAGGATARPFITHHNALDSDFYLRIAPELYLKRLVVGGLERVYEINRNFRNEGISTRHNPEFTMAEFYWAHHTYTDAMDLVEAMLRTIAEKVHGETAVPFGDHMIDFAQPFKRMSIKDAVLEYGGYTESDIAPESIDALLEKHNAKIAQKDPSYGQKLFALFEEVAEPQLIQPTFITGFPIEISPLSRRDADNKELAARFELYIGGMEISNSFNELNDPFDQADRFHQQLEAHRAGDDEAHQYDADYILALEYGLPPAVGVGIGIDRLAMVMTNTPSIKEVILFPTLKKK